VHFSLQHCILSIESIILSQISFYPLSILARLLSIGAPQFQESRFSLNNELQSLFRISHLLFQQCQLSPGDCNAALVAQSLLDFQALLVELAGLLVLPSGLGQHAQLLQRTGHAALVAQFLINFQALLVELAGLFVVPGVLGQHA